MWICGLWIWSFLKILILILIWICSFLKVLIFLAIWIWSFLKIDIDIRIIRYEHSDFSQDTFIFFLVYTLVSKNIALAAENRGNGAPSSHSSSKSGFFNQPGLFRIVLFFLLLFLTFFQPGSSRIFVYIFF